jgi:hypothetical protein
MLWLFLILLLVSPVYSAQIPTVVKATTVPTAIPTVGVPYYHHPHQPTPVPTPAK